MRFAPRNPGAIRHAALLAAGLALLASGCKTTPTVPAQAPRPDPVGLFRVEPLTEGVYAVIRQDPPGLMVDANNGFILGPDSVIVVDANGAPSLSRAVQQSLRTLTDRPVRQLVNTHWHDDHITGNAAWLEANPGVEIVGHAANRDYLEGPGAGNRAAFVKDAAAFMPELEQLLANGKSLAGGPLSMEERAAIESDLALAGLVLREATPAPPVLPTVAVTKALTIATGDRLVEVRSLGGGHTTGDLIVHLPRERIVFAGDLVVWPVPLIGAEQSSIEGWIVALEALVALDPAIIVPGHGPVLRDTAYVEQLLTLLRTLRDGANAAVARGDSLDATRQSIALGDLRRSFAGDSPMRAILFDNYVAGPGVAAAYREARARAAPPRAE